MMIKAVLEETKCALVVFCLCACGVVLTGQTAELDKTDLLLLSVDNALCDMKITAVSELSLPKDTMNKSIESAKNQSVAEHGAAANLDQFTSMDNEVTQLRDVEISFQEGKCLVNHKVQKSAYNEAFEYSSFYEPGKQVEILPNDNSSNKKVVMAQDVNGQSDSFNQLNIFSFGRGLSRYVGTNKKIYPSEENPKIFILDLLADDNQTLIGRFNLDSEKGYCWAEGKFFCNGKVTAVFNADEFKKNNEIWLPAGVTTESFDENGNLRVKSMTHITAMEFNPQGEKPLSLLDVIPSDSVLINK
jgi:hypothetical protein